MMQVCNIETLSFVSFFLSETTMTAMLPYRISLSSCSVLERRFPTIKLEHTVNTITELHWNGPMDTAILPDVCAIATAYDATAQKKEIRPRREESHTQNSALNAYRIIVRFAKTKRRD
jgi:hypothetical protein